MPKRKLLITRSLVLVFAVLVLLSSVCYSYQVPDDTIVYVTPTGEKYHREDCTYTGSVRRMTIAEAGRRGYGPCSRHDSAIQSTHRSASSAVLRFCLAGRSACRAPFLIIPASRFTFDVALKISLIKISSVISLRPFHFSCSHFHRVQMQQLADC